MWHYINPDHNIQPTALAAVPAWAPRLINRGVFLTVPGTGFEDSEHVGMEEWTGSPQGVLLWTQAATGGCSPLAVVVRDEESCIIGLAHLCLNRDQDAEEMGEAFRNHTNDARSVSLVLVHYTGNNQSPEMTAFTNFERGFGHAIPDHNKGIVYGNSGTAAVHPDGYVGELPTRLKDRKFGYQVADSWDGVNVVPSTVGAASLWAPRPRTRRRPGLEIATHRNFF